MLPDNESFSKIRDIAGSIEADESWLRLFVLSRAVEIAAKQNDAQGVKCLELVARLALGDKNPGTGNDYTNQDGDPLSGLSNEELLATRASALEMIAWTKGQQEHNGTNGAAATNE